MNGNKGLRKRADAIARGKTALSRESIEAMTPEEIQRMFHDLQVHQIELEMQNDELRRTQAELAAARARYFHFYELAPVGYCTLAENGMIQEGNLTIAALLGMAREALVKQPITRFIHKEDQDIFSFHRNQLFATREPQTCELQMLKHDGTAFWAHLATTVTQDDVKAPQCRLILSDITARRFREKERELISRLIVRINAPGDFRQRLSELTTSLQNWSGCEAVGIRLHDGEDYPYYETRGFPPEFVQAEKYLCDYGLDGNILRDGKGDPVLECMCGNVLCARFDPAKPFFTAHGSFWSNCTTTLLASTTEADRQARTRNYCNGMGYESVALIPLRYGDQVFGLIQFNDHRPERFTHSLIASFERLADSLAIALLQRQTDEALRKSESRFRTLFDDSPIAIWEADFSAVKTRFDELRQSGVTDFGSYFDQSPEEIPGLAARVKILAVNQRSADLLGADSTAQLVRELPRYFTDASNQVFRKELIALTEGNKTFQSEISILNTQGEAIDLDLVLSIPREHLHDLSRVLISFLDITGRKLAEAEKTQREARSRQIQKAESLGLMAGAIAHNFNNHLQAVMGNLEMAMDELPRDSDTFQSLTEALKAARKAAHVSGLMLTYKGQAPGRQAPLDLSRSIRRNLSLIQAAAPDGVSLKADFPDSGPVIRANAGQIQQILTNLVTNAWEAIGDTQGTIGLTLKTVSRTDIPALNRFPVNWQPSNSAYACIEVADTGCGIPGKDIEKLFDPFFTTKFTGRGLGLPVAIGIIGAHEGAITVESTPGKGSVFRVFLPMAAEEVFSPIQKKETAPEIEAGGTVLVVDDEAQVRRMVRMMLTRMGFTVMEARDGIEAVAVFRQHQDEIRCVICDLTMPRMNGWDTLTALRSLSPGIPVVLSSGYDEEQVMAGEHAELPQAFLGKPYRLNELRGTISRVLIDSQHP